MYQLILFDRDSYFKGQEFYWNLREAAEAARSMSRFGYVRTAAIAKDGKMYAGRYRAGKYLASLSPATY